MESNLCGLVMKMIVLFSVYSSLSTHLFILVFIYLHIHPCIHKIFVTVDTIPGIDLGAELER